jgi:signal transduction histidine kinase
VRRRLVLSTIAIVLVVLAALAVPVGIIVYQSAETELRDRIEDDATSIANALTDEFVAGGQPDLSTIEDLVTRGDSIRVFNRQGAVVAELPADLDDPIVVQRPGPSGTTIELATDRGPLDDRFREQVLILLGLAVGALLAAAALAAIQARQLARPLERLSSTASRLGSGDFSTSNLPATGIPEIDGISGALKVSGTRVASMLSMERHFTADATHQLRTGLTGIAMRFEILARDDDPDVVVEAEAGLQQTQQMNATIDELLALTRDNTVRERGAFDLVALVDDHVAEWAPRFAATRRTLAVITARQVPVIGTKGLAGQVVDILIDNALRHGRGAVTLLIDGPAVVVIDQGPGISDDQARTVFDAPSDPSAPHGRGLPLARRLAQVDGGSVEVLDARPLRVRYSLVPAAATLPEKPNTAPGRRVPGGGERKETPSV